jgi:hypothetical protein
MFCKIQFSNNVLKLLLLCSLLSFVFNPCHSQIKILFDATKAETAGSADWVIDADLHNIQWNPAAVVCGSSACHQSNAQRIPTPSQPLPGVITDEAYWDGALSFWGIDCAYKGYTVETLPAISGRITYGDGSNQQDLSNYKAFIICEPNIPFTDAEKTALLNFVNNGGGLFMISDHNVSDRNNDGWDSPHIWNDFMQINSSQNNNPFGFIFDYSNISETSTKVAAVAASDSIIHGAWGNVTKVKWSNGTTITVDPGVNASVKPVIYKTSVTNASGNAGVMVVYSRYGQGKIVAIGDSSPCDDGTGDTGDALFPGYNGDVSPNHRNLLMNATIWLVSSDKKTYTFSGDGNWSNSLNWTGGKVPPLTLPPGDSIIIDPLINGNCVLDVTQHIAAGATITVTTGKNMLIPGTLNIQ